MSGQKIIDGLNQAVGYAQGRAAGIEAAALVAENFAWIEWPSENALATCPDYRRGIADAIRALAAAPPPPVPVQGESGEPVLCTGCGSRWTDADLKRERAADPKLISCCPERRPLTLRQYRDHIRELEREVRAMRASASPDPVCDSYARENQQFHDHILELEGEVARKDELHRKLHDTFEELGDRADRLLQAAQAARGACGEAKQRLSRGQPDRSPDTREALRSVCEALASLASVLDGGEG